MQIDIKWQNVQKHFIFNVFIFIDFKTSKMLIVFL